MSYPSEAPYPRGATRFAELGRILAPGSPHPPLPSHPSRTVASRGVLAGYSGGSAPASHRTSLFSPFGRPIRRYSVVRRVYHRTSSCAVLADPPCRRRGPHALGRWTPPETRNLRAVRAPPPRRQRSSQASNPAAIGRVVALQQGHLLGHRLRRRHEALERPGELARGRSLEPPQVVGAARKRRLHPLPVGSPGWARGPGGPWGCRTRHLALVHLVLLPASRSIVVRGRQPGGVPGIRVYTRRPRSRGLARTEGLSALVAAGLKSSEATRTRRGGSQAHTQRRSREPEPGLRERPPRAPTPAGHGVRSRRDAERRYRAGLTGEAALRPSRRRWTTTGPSSRRHAG